MGARVGVLLSGCGAYDGSDLHEAVLVLLALERRGARPVCIAPDVAQLHVVDHLSGHGREEEHRGVWEEAGRIARGKLEQPTPGLTGGLEGLVVIGGFGVAKNLIGSFARPGEPRRIEPSVESMLQALTQDRRPVGAVGLGKTLLAALLGEDPFEGSEFEPSDQLRRDPERRLYHVPGFLGQGRLPQVAAGIEAMVEEMLSASPLQVVP
ncbi:MAG: hypothetical protein V3U98_11725 [Acidobacteriota bacterium]